jgi:hypothetical protein
MLRRDLVRHRQRPVTAGLRHFSSGLVGVVVVGLLLPGGTQHGDGIDLLRHEDREVTLAHVETDAGEGILELGNKSRRILQALLAVGQPAGVTLGERLQCVIGGFAGETDRVVLVSRIVLIE